MKSKRLAGVLALIVILAGIALYALWPGLDSGTPVNDPARYREVLNRLREHGDPWVPQFPVVIPASARNVQFSYESNWQGMLRLQLRYDLPPEEVSDIVRRLQIPGKTAAASAQWPQHISIPPEFTRLVLDAGQESDGTKGHDFGIAVNQAAHQVMYWTEEW